MLNITHRGITYEVNDEQGIRDVLSDIELRRVERETLKAEIVAILASHKRAVRATLGVR